MSVVRCLCGAGIHDTVFPSTHKSHMISDQALDDITTYSAEDEPIKRDDFDEKSVEVLLCWACDRFLVEDKSTGRYTFYKREEPT